eukprot:gnl/Hemi2/9376_TR3266_c0_g1_i1.p1 gnl/Hemi2/9376_TR3266_c0_g1~~gnl/Hemi2/9376_TR3266_c0_g1_i1.p1  ORF type:complete len:158 (+),score=44.96 gnl/Hemi2/9376_TR3266_c0_g1_i1:67-474(+)
MGQAPSTVDFTHCDREGMLTKLSEHLKKWRRRRFILKGADLYYFTPEQNIGPGVCPHGVINLANARAVKAADDKTKMDYSFSIQTPENTYYLYADSDVERQRWVAALSRVVTQRSNSFSFLPDKCSGNNYSSTAS